MSLWNRFLKPLKKFLKIKKASKSKRRRKVRSVKKKRIVRKSKPSKRVKKNVSRRSSKQLVKKQPLAKKKASPVKENLVGEITHFFSKIQVVVIKMTAGSIQVGNRIHVKGAKTNFVQTVQSLQIESVDVKTAQKGQLVGLKVIRKAKEGDKVYLVYK